MLFSTNAIIRYAFEGCKTLDQIHDELLEMSTHMVKMVEDQEPTSWEVDLRIENSHCGFRCYTARPVGEISSVSSINIIKALFSFVNNAAVDRDIRLLEYDSEMAIELRLFNECFISKLEQFKVLHQKVKDTTDGEFIIRTEDDEMLMKDIHELVIREHLARRRKIGCES